MYENKWNIVSLRFNSGFISMIIQIVPELEIEDAEEYNIYTCIISFRYTTSFTN